MKAMPKTAGTTKAELATVASSGPAAAEPQKSLRGFLHQLEARLPQDFHRVTRKIAPANFEVTALLQHLENEKRFPVLFF
jgi:hypothetical protein